MINFPANAFATINIVNVLDHTTFVVVFITNAPKFNTLRLFSVVRVGAVLTGVADNALPLLSAHAVTLTAPVTVEVSAASNHIAIDAPDIVVVVSGVYGRTAAEAVDATLEPPSLAAVTVNVYNAPSVRVVKVAVVAPVVVTVIEPGDEVAVYPMMADPPIYVGAVHDTVACRLTPLTDAVTAVGGSGGTISLKTTISPKPERVPPLTVPAVW
jgi:hypothetical protein